MLFMLFDWLPRAASMLEGLCYRLEYWFHSAMRNPQACSVGFSQRFPKVLSNCCGVGCGK
jgi:hypothetical protein